MRGKNLLAILAIAAAWTPAFAMPADSVEPARYDLKIERQSLSSALQEFAKQSGVQIIFFSKVTDGFEAPSLSGKYTAAAALTKLLNDSQLTFKELNPKTIEVQPKAAVNNLENSHTASPLASNSSGDGSNEVQQGKGIRLAQAGEPQSAPENQSVTDSSENQTTEASALKQKTQTVEQVVVTGTRIRGASPASPVIVIDRAAIDQSGFATTGDLIRSLPESFGGGQNPGVNGTGQANAAYNYGSASTANLRGIGSDATLTLVNGHRLAFNGISNSVDLSAIPLAAVSRVEILTDGASALYGSDAVAGVVNVILRPDYDGAETTVRYGDSSGGGGEERQFSQVLGASGEPGGFVLNYEHYERSTLLANQRDFSSSAPNPTSVIPEDVRDTALFSGHLNVTPSIALFADALYTHREPKTQFRFSPTTYTTTTEINQYGLAGGIRFQLPNNWNGSATGSAARDADNYNQLAGSKPTSYSFQNKTVSGDVEFSGPLIAIWSGPLAVAISAGYRREETDVNFAGMTAASRDIKYEAIELNIPVVASDPSRPMLHQLELSVAARHEKYSDFQDANNPKLGLTYVPFDDITLKGTWGRSFHAPGLWEEYGPRATFAENASSFGINSPGMIGLYGAGANPNLRPETTRDWTTSFDYRPSWLTGAKVTATVYGIDYRNRIVVPLSTTVGILGNPIYAPFIVVDPSAGLISTVTNPPYDFSNFTSSRVSPSNVFAYYQAYYQNVARQKVSGVDLLFDYHLNSAIGLWNPSFNVTHIEINQYATPDAPRNDISGTIFNVPRYRARGGLAWVEGRWSASGFVNYTSSEIDNSGTFVAASKVRNGSVGSWTTVDVQLTYEVLASTPLLNHLRAAISAQNLFDSAPPFVPKASTVGQYAGLGYDPANASPLGRFLSLTVTKKF